MRRTLLRGPLFLLIRNRSKKMSRGFPSMTALLGLLAIAGYQNRDKLAELLGGLAPNQPAAPGQHPPGGRGGLLGPNPSRVGWAVCLAASAGVAWVACLVAASASWSNASGRMARVRWRTRG